MAASNAQLSEPCLYEIIMTWLAFRIHLNGIYKKFASRLPITGREVVLDFGCGMGTVAYHTAKKLPEGKLFCVDISEKWLIACRRTLRRYENVSFLCGEIDCMSLPERSFDVIYIHYVFHDIPNNRLEAIIPELSRLLKENGKLLFRESFKDVTKIRFIQNLMEHSELHRENSRITDIPFMGNALENVYRKNFKRI